MKIRAFTLIELLVVIAIIALLSVLFLPVLSSMRQSANKTREIQAGHELSVAYAASAADNDGELMVGYASSAEALDDLGRPVKNPVSNRYPWRLAKYLNYKVVGTLLVNEQAKIADLRSDQANYNYMVSLAPTFGMNSTLVGGNSSGALAPTASMYRRFGKFCVTRIGEVQKPANLIVFASAHFINGDETYLGYHSVEPPNLTGKNWADHYDEKQMKSLGYVHLRYGGKAVVAMMDGHCELLDEAALRDMRRWSNQAAELDDRDFQLQKVN
jgi:prepilin-type N-terminal cleavage/methylation domain-containing protein/prepilin-type processing-associated H-X9-DG protein